VLVLDDLQWGDNDSAALLNELLRPPAPPLLLLACYRAEDAERSVFLRSLRPADASRRLEVGPLSSAATRALAGQLLGEGADERLARAITRAAEGNPFFVTEVARHLRDAGGSLDDEVTLEQVFTERVGRLTEPARRLLAAVAVAGQPIDEALAAEAAGIGGESRAALAELRAGHLVRRGASSEAAIECYHERLRRVVVETLDEGARRTWHQQLARALASSDADDPELMLVHLEGGGERERAAAWAARAAKRAAAALAFDRAAALYERALALDAGTGRALRAEQGQALANAGRGHEAARAFLRAAADGRDRQALQWQRRALEQLLISGHIDEGMALLERLGRTFGLELPSAPRRVLAALIWARARLRLRGLGFTRRALEQIPADDLQRLDLAMAVTRGLGNVVPIQMALLQSHCVRMALDTGEPARIALALGGEVIFSACRGSRTRRRTGQLLHRLHDVGRGIDDRQIEGFVTLVDGMASLLSEGRFGEGLRRFDAAAAILRAAPSHSRYLGRARDRLRLDMAQLYGVECLRRLGRLGELCARVPPLLRDAERRGNLLLRATLRTGAGHMRWLAEDRPDALRDAVDEAMAGWSQRGFHLQHMWELWTRCRIDLYRGDEGAALERLEARWPAIRRSTLLRTQLVLLDLLDLRGKLHLAAAARAPASERPGLLQVVEQMARALEREGVAHGWPLARLLVAGAAAVRGDTARAVAALREARRGFEAARMALLAAAAGARLGGELAEEATAYMAAQRVVSPERMLALLAPGF
jgi:tetratricopeptide (TPR) repeat protein